MPSEERDEKPRRVRLDQLLVQLGLVPTRQRAQAAIMAGHVYVDGRRVDKPGTPVDPEARVEVRGEPIPYVSRGGLKLAHALDAFGLEVAGRVCMDVGASTGGFTDCLLQRGAARVYAVDVGYGQLDWRLRQDERVVVMERTNVRHLTPADIPEPVEILVIDVSFISLRLVLPPLLPLLAPGGWVVALVKPQFEAGRQHVGKGGVVRDPRVHRQVLSDLIRWLPTAGWQPRRLTASPIRGPKGNVEFFLALQAKKPGEVPGPGAAGGLDPSSPQDWDEEVARVVDLAHRDGTGEPL